MDVKNMSFGMFVASTFLVFHSAGNLSQFDIILEDSLQFVHHYLPLFLNFSNAINVIS